MRLLFLFFTLFLSYEVISDEQIKGRVWNRDSDKFLAFPEQEGTFVPLRLKKWKELKKDELTVGVAFSGGGTRSATLTLGQLRSLNALGFLDKINYISAVSGGSWATVPFIYYRKDDIDVFLGNYTQPNELSKNDLKQKTKGSFAKAISKSTVFWKTIKAWTKGKKDGNYSA